MEVLIDDAEQELLARAVCVAWGYDPDKTHVLKPYGHVGKLWQNDRVREHVSAFVAMQKCLPFRGPVSAPRDDLVTVTPQGLRARADLVEGKLNDSGSCATHLRDAARYLESLIEAAENVVRVFDFDCDISGPIETLREKLP